MVKTSNAPVYASVPRSWEGETAVVLATGPSLCQADVDQVHGRARVLAIKDAIRLAPQADCWYGCDAKFWRHYGDQIHFTGPKYSLDPLASKWAGVLRQTGFNGLELDPTGLRTGKHSGAQAIGLAVHLGAKRIVLLGYDLQDGAKGETHFTKRPYSTSVSPYAAFLPWYETAVAPLKQLDIQVINASRVSALTTFPRMSLTDALRVGHIDAAA